MPISSKILTPRSAEAGKIKIGQVAGKKGKAGKQPQKFESKDGPYFVVTKTIRGTDEAQNFAIDAAVMKQLEQYMDADADGKKRLRQIPVMFDSDIIEEIAPSRLAMYRGTNLFCTGTGEGEATRWEADVPSKVSCPCAFLRAREGEKCKPNLILWPTIVAGGETRLGVRHAFRTTGWNSIKSIIASLETIQRQVGTLVGVKLWLCVKWDLKKDAKNNTRRVPVVYLECRTKDLMGLREQAISSARKRLEVIQMQSPTVLSLPAPAVGESSRTQQEVATEWYPPKRDAEPVDDSEDDDDELFDPETGVVYEDDDDGESRFDDGGTVTPQLAAPPQETQDENPAADEPRWFKVLADKLATLVEIRDLPRGTADEKKQSMKEVLVQITTEKFGQAIAFKSLTLAQAGTVDDIVQKEINAKRSEVLTHPE